MTSVCVRSRVMHETKNYGHDSSLERLYIHECMYACLYVRSRVYLFVFECIGTKTKTKTKNGVSTRVKKKTIDGKSCKMSYETECSYKKVQWSL